LKRSSILASLKSNFSNLANLLFCLLFILVGEFSNIASSASSPGSGSNGIVPRLNLLLPSLPTAGLSIVIYPSAPILSTAGPASSPLYTLILNLPFLPVVIETTSSLGPDPGLNKLSNPTVS